MYAQILLVVIWLREVFLRFTTFMLLLPGLFLGRAAEETPEKAWSNKSELSAVWTGGNAESSSLGFKNDYQRTIGKGEINFKVGGIRAESTRFTRTATGTPDNFIVTETEETEKTAENYYLRFKYDRKINERFFWFTGLDWERNEFAGIDNRSSISAGVGNVWVETKRRKLKTDYGFQYTKEDNVIEFENTDDTFGAIVLTYVFFQKIGKNAAFDQTFNGVANLEETRDFRVDLNSGLTATLTERLAIKVGLQLLYDNQPSFDAITLEDGGTTVPFELDELDTVFTTSLVINF